MSREIRLGKDGDDALTKIAKLIPGEVTAAYLAISNYLGPDYGLRDASYVASTVFLWALCPIYLWVQQNVRNPLQIAATTALYPIWVFNMSPTRFGNGLEQTGAIVLFLATACIPLIFRSGNGSAP